MKPNGHADHCQCRGCVQRFAEGGQVRDPSSHRTPGQITRQINGYNKDHQDLIVARHKARRQMIREGKVRVGDGKDVDHRRPLAQGGSNHPSNWRVRPASENRSWRDEWKPKPK